MTTLYKKDSTGSIRVLHISTDGVVVLSEAGKVGGKLTTHTKQVQAKNIGRTNETTQQEQCAKEVDNIIMKKKKDGYFLTEEEASSNEIVKPMLARSYEEGLVSYPCIMQPKLDGMRALWINGKLISRSNREITTMPHIVNALKDVTEILDGELYIHGENFQENMRAIKKYRKGQSEKVTFYVYDMITSDNYAKRRMETSWIINNAVASNYVSTVDADTINSKEEADVFHASCITKGFEGSMIREKYGAGYEKGKRAKQLLKRKDFIDEACEIVDVLESDKVLGQGIFQCTYKGNVFGCGMKFSHEERAEILLNKDKYIGQTAEIRFFEYSEDGVPRFPVCVGTRLDK